MLINARKMRMVIVKHHYKVTNANDNFQPSIDLIDLSERLRVLDDDVSIYIHERVRSTPSRCSPKERQPLPVTPCERATNHVHFWEQNVMWISKKSLRWSDDRFFTKLQSVAICISMRTGVLVTIAYNAYWPFLSSFVPFYICTGPTFSQIKRP